MGVADHTAEQVFPYKLETVFEHLTKALPEEGFTVKESDNVIGRVVASTGVSMFSWGETISIFLKRIDNENTSMTIDSGLKLGFNLAGAHRNRKNIDKIILAVSKSIQSKSA